MSEKSNSILKRTHSCGQLRKEDIGKRVRLCGWVRSYRDHGGVIFVDLRDRDGITQIVFDPRLCGEQLHRQAEQLRSEWVISVGGIVRERGPERVNPKLSTGEIEVVVDEIVVLNKSDTPPFEPDSVEKISEETRLRYRYIDLRRQEMISKLRLRHQICRAMRAELDERGFIEVETPFLTKSTPEGARDFLVPARLQPGTFYALPQSPQLFKQILMISGVDKYYQIVRCFRDEDLRADRQPEFTQLDIEMSFVEEDDVIEVTNAVLRRVCEEIGKPFPAEVPVLSYSEAMEKYGCDRPDMRFEMLLHDVTEIVRDCSFRVFQDAIAAGGIVKAICLSGGSSLPRSQIDQYITFATQLGAGGLAWCKVGEDGFTGGVAKFFDESVQLALRKEMDASAGDLLFFIADTPETVNKVLSALRIRLAEDTGLIEPDKFAWCWVRDFPLVEWNQQEQRWDSLHHPFTSPRLEDLDKLQSDPAAVRSRAYDIVLNGIELGGGSIRIHSREVQQKVFDLLGISRHDAEERFGFLLEALRFGAPPHGGIALGLDRVAMMMSGSDSIRDVIAFPKTQRGICPLTGAPASVEENQLTELGLKMINLPKKGN